MGHADAEPASDIGSPVVASGQAVEITAMGLLQSADGRIVGQQRCQFGQAAQVFVEAVGKSVLGDCQLAADGGQMFRIDRGKFQESLAGFNFGFIYPHFGGDSIHLG